MAGLFNLISNTNIPSYAREELLNKYKKELNTDSNIYNNPSYLSSVKEIKPSSSFTPSGSEAYGYFEPQNPGVLNVSYNMPGALSTTAHEATHSQMNDYVEWLRKNTDSKQLPNVLGMNMLDYSPYSSLSQEHKDFRERVSNAFNKYKKEYNLGAQFAGHPSEMMADLQGIEATLPSGKTILDTNIGKDIFKTKEEKQIYLKSSLPGVMKALEYDPSLWEVAKDRADYAMRVFKDKATASSYAKAAADAFKAFMSGPEAKVEYQDPFGDTTK